MCVSVHACSWRNNTLLALCERSVKAHTAGTESVTCGEAKKTERRTDQGESEDERHRGRARGRWRQTRDEAAETN